MEIWISDCLGSDDRDSRLDVAVLQTEGLAGEAFVRRAASAEADRRGLPAGASSEVRGAGLLEVERSASHAELIEDPEFSPDCFSRFLAGDGS